MNKNLIIITVGRLAQMIVMFATYRVLSSVLSVADMGIYYFLLSISAAFGLIYANPIGMYTNRFLHSWQFHGVLFKNLKTVLISLIVGSCFIVPFLLFFKEKISLDNHSFSSLIAVLLFYVFSTTLNGTVVPSLNILGYTRQFVTWTFLTNALGLLFSYLLAAKIFNGPLYWLLGQGIALFLCASAALLVMYRNEGSEAKINNTIPFLKRAKKVFRFGFPVAVTNIAVWVLGQSYRFFYKENIDLEILGEMAFGLGLASSLSVAVEYLLQQIYLPEFYKNINNPDSSKSRTWNNLLSNLVPSYIYVMFFIIGLSPFLMRVLANIKFKNAHIYLTLGAGVEFLRMLGNVFTIGTHSEMKTYKAIGPYVTGGAITLLGILSICQYPIYVSLTPVALMAGYLASLIYLRVNVGQIIAVEINLQQFIKNLMFAFVFLTALLVRNLSENFYISVATLLAYGLLLTFFLYRSYLQGKKCD